MQPYPDVEKIIRQTQRYEFADGLRDIQIGLMFMTYGFVGWLIFEPAWIGFIYRLKLNFGAWAMWVAILLLLILPAVVADLVRRAAQAIRQRRLWRQSGFVKPSRWVMPRRANGIAVALFLLALGISLVLKILLAWENEVIWRLIWVATGLATGYTFIYFGRYLGLRHYVWVGILGALGAIVPQLLPLTFGQSFLGFALAWGLVFLVSGLVVLQKALRPSEGQSDEQPG